MHASLTTSRRVDVKGGRIHVQARDGDGPALVFLHYWGGSLRTWAPVVERLDPARAFAALDQRGWGESHGVPGPYGMERLADDAQQVVETLGYADYVVVGHSMGGKAAQVLAARRPTGLRGMVLVAPATPAPAGVTPELQDMISHAYDTTAAIDQSIGQMLTHGALSDAMRRQVHQDSSRAGREARLAWPLEGLVEDFS
ncbi:MAG TPA: alpha/beta fold hydrolase, partial [Streptomyces sp.]